MSVIDWLTDPANWTGPDGIPSQMGYHLLYTGIALVIAAVIAVPLGVLVGYTGKGERLVAGSRSADARRLAAKNQVARIENLFPALSDEQRQRGRERPGRHIEGHYSGLRRRLRLGQGRRRRRKQKRRKRG